MNKKTITAILAGVSAGIAIYLISKSIKKKKDRARFVQPKRTYAHAYEYSL